MKITILTPTYNRKHTLIKLYKSLLNQTDSAFDWMIVDDGSTDNTKELIDNFIADGKIKIKYYYEKNGGKHRALNFGISKIKTKYTFIVDSDDWLDKDAIKQIHKYIKKYSSDKSIACFSFLRGYPNGSINGQKFKKNEYRSNYIECRINHKVVGDKAEVYRTDVLRKYKFLEIKGENFLFEDYVWIKIAQKYDTIHINQIIYYGDYLFDGLTKNIQAKKKSSPIGMMKRAELFCSKSFSCNNRIKGMIMYISYGHLRYKYKNLYNKTNYKTLFVICILPSILFSLKLKRS